MMGITIKCCLVKRKLKKNSATNARIINNTNNESITFKMIDKRFICVLVAKNVVDNFEA